ncbi:MAG TPA: hypothetical protein VFB16_06035 [Bauldia sp.]|nr:hypothetical protein [Bauldia sp.]
MYTAKDYDRALLSPTSVFERPMDVVATDSMTAKQKLDVLKRWESEARQLEIAVAENMGGGEASKLSDVRAAIDLLVAADGIEEKAA